MHLSLEGQPVPITEDASSRMHEFYPLTKVYIVILRERTKFDAFLYSPKCHTGYLAHSAQNPPCYLE